MLLVAFMIFFFSGVFPVFDYSKKEIQKEESIFNSEASGEKENVKSDSKTIKLYFHDEWLLNKSFSVSNVSFNFDLLPEHLNFHPERTVPPPECI